MEKMQLDADVAKLKLLKADHLSQRYGLEDALIKKYPRDIAEQEERIKSLAEDKFFALMSEKFRPFVVVSCIGTVSEGSNIIAPAKISFLKITDRKYEITVSPCSTLGESVFFEINLHEAKLFQDTTVESNNPKTNNAFGSVGTACVCQAIRCC